MICAVDVEWSPVSTFWYFYILLSWNKNLDIWIVVKKDKLLGKKPFPRKEIGQNWEKDQRLSGSKQRGL